jgi:hypothetical protein
MLPKGRDRSFIDAAFESQLNMTDRGSVLILQHGNSTSQSKDAFLRTQALCGFDCHGRE